MKGKIVEREGILYVEYFHTGTEADEVVKDQMKLAFYDRPYVSVGEEVEFECKDSYTVSGEEIATIKNK